MNLKERMEKMINTAINEDLKVAVHFELGEGDVEYHVCCYSIDIRFVDNYMYIEPSEMDCMVTINLDNFRIIVDEEERRMDLECDNINIGFDFI